MVLTTAEEMALAVLRGDVLAARTLADLLLENTAHGSIQLPPVKVLTTEVDRIRVIVYVREDVDAGAEAVEELRSAVEQWLMRRGDNVLILTGIDRIEVYELPPLPVELYTEDTPGNA